MPHAAGCEHPANRIETSERRNSAGMQTVTDRRFPQCRDREISIGQWTTCVRLVHRHHHWRCVQLLEQTANLLVEKLTVAVVVWGRAQTEITRECGTRIRHDPTPLAAFYVLKGLQCIKFRQDNSQVRSAEPNNSEDSAKYRPGISSDTLLRRQEIVELVGHRLHLEWIEHEKYAVGMREELEPWGPRILRVLKILSRNVTDYQDLGHVVPMPEAEDQRVTLVGISGVGGWGGFQDSTSLIQRRFVMISIRGFRCAVEWFDYGVERFSQQLQLLDQYCNVDRLARRSRTSHCDTRDLCISPPVDEDIVTCWTYFAGGSTEFEFGILRRGRPARMGVGRSTQFDDLA